MPSKKVCPDSTLVDPRAEKHSLFSKFCTFFKRTQVDPSCPQKRGKILIEHLNNGYEFLPGLLEKDLQTALFDRSDDTASQEGLKSPASP